MKAEKAKMYEIKAQEAKMKGKQSSQDQNERKPAQKAKFWRGRGCQQKPLGLGS